MPTPFEKEEYKTQEKWLKKARNGELDVNECISSWFDICGFGGVLDECDWNLAVAQKSNLLKLLSEIYNQAAMPFLIGVDPMPFETVLILNDGIARTVDLKNKNLLNSQMFLFYLRDLLFSHNNLLRLAKRYGLGLRTVLAGGERVQYSSAMFSGQSILYHDEENISDFGEKLLKKNFVYNPAEFQMNTAFAKAFTLDSLGSKSKITPNCIFVEKKFWQCIDGIENIRQVMSKNLIQFSHNDKLVFELTLGDDIIVKYHNLEMSVNQILSFKILKQFDGDEVIINFETAVSKQESKM